MLSNNTWAEETGVLDIPLKPVEVAYSARKGNLAVWQFGNWLCALLSEISTLKGELLEPMLL